MAKMLDGPAAGIEVSCLRAPLFLRVVRDRATGKVDVLDLPEDAPRDGEDVFIYRMVAGDQFGGLVNIGGRCYDGVGNGEYEHLPDVDGSALRGTREWRAWALGQKVR